LQLCPYILLRGTWGEAPITLSAYDTLCPLVWLPAPRVHKPRLDIAFAIGHIDYQGRRTGLFDLAGILIPLDPAVTLFLCNGFAFALLGHGLCRPLPDLHAHHAYIDTLRRKRHRGMEQILFTRFALDGAHPGFGLSRAVMQKRRVLHQPHHLLQADALQGGMGMA
jgi:hypothetical protein